MPKPHESAFSQEQLQQIIVALEPFFAAINEVLVEHGEKLICLQEDMSAVKQDVSVLKADVSDLKQDVSNLQDDVSVIKRRQEAQQSMLDIHDRLVSHTRKQR
ncbi:hypothetical protein HYW32_02295 [Candidatus Berkelbacteria bacterium]|nr:hypothetical protein [Candidatus Berkelbacteria bacterium]